MVIWNHCEYLREQNSFLLFFLFIYSYLHRPSMQDPQSILDMFSIIGVRHSWLCFFYFPTRSCPKETSSFTQRRCRTRDIFFLINEDASKSSAIFMLFYAILFILICILVFCFLHVPTQSCLKDTSSFTLICKAPDTFYLFLSTL